MNKTVIESTKLNHLQSLRGIAVLLVVWKHSAFLVGKDIQESMLGFTGVPLFFIISGFIMVYTTRNITSNPLLNIKEFSMKRLIRIVPLFYFCILAWIIICRKDFIVDPQWVKIIETAFFFPHFTDELGPFYGFWILGVNWSLNYEMFFYALFAFSLLFSSKRYYFLFIIFFALLIAIPIVFKGGISMDRKVNYDFQFQYLNMMTNPILWYFVIGVVLGLLVDKASRLKLSKLAIGLFYGVSICIFLAYIFKITPTNLFFEMGACTLIIWGAILMDLNRNNGWKPIKFLCFLGDISYSIYLVHAVIFMYMPLLANKFGVENHLLSWGSFSLAMFSIILCSYLTYTFIEIKFRRFLKKILAFPSQAS